MYVFNFAFSNFDLNAILGILKYQNQTCIYPSTIIIVPHLSHQRKVSFTNKKYYVVSCTGALVGSNIFLSTLFSNPLSLCSSLNVRDEVSHQYRTTGKIIVLYILIFKHAHIYIYIYILVSVNTVNLMKHRYV
jgi:hypothetical protein